MKRAAPPGHDMSAGDARQRPRVSPDMPEGSLLALSPARFVELTKLEGTSSISSHHQSISSHHQQELDKKDAEIEKLRAERDALGQSLALATAEINSERNKLLAESTNEERKRLRAVLDVKCLELKSVHRALKESQSYQAEMRRRRQGCEVFLDQLQEQRAGDVPAILDAIQRHCTDCGVVQPLFVLLMMLCWNNEASQVAASVGIERILRAMELHHDQPSLLAAACGALVILSAQNAHNQVRIAAAGGIERIIAVMDQHKTHSGVHVQATTRTRKRTRTHAHTHTNARACTCARARLCILGHSAPVCTS